MHANFPTAHQFLWGFERLPRILWSWVEGGTSVWVSLCSLPPACWSGVSLVWSVSLHRKAKTAPRKNGLIIRSGQRVQEQIRSWSWNIPRSSLGNHAGSGGSQRQFFGPLPIFVCRKLSPGSTTSSQWWGHSLTPFWPTLLSSGKEVNIGNCPKSEEPKSEETPTSSYPKNSEPLTEGPPTQEIHLKPVVKNHDGILLSIKLVALRFCVKRAFSPRPPLQSSHHLWGPLKTNQVFGRSLIERARSSEQNLRLLIQ